MPPQELPIYQAFTMIAGHTHRTVNVEAGPDRYWDETHFARALLQLPEIMSVFQRASRSKQPAVRASGYRSD